MWMRAVTSSPDRRDAIDRRRSWQADAPDPDAGDVEPPVSAAGRRDGVWSYAVDGHPLCVDPGVRGAAQARPMAADRPAVEPGQRRRGSPPLPGLPPSGLEQLHRAVSGGGPVAVVGRGDPVAVALRHLGTAVHLGLAAAADAGADVRGYQPPASGRSAAGAAGGKACEVQRLCLGSGHVSREIRAPLQRRERNGWQQLALERTGNTPKVTTWKLNSSAPPAPSPARNTWCARARRRCWWTAACSRASSSCACATGRRCPSTRTRWTPWC